jgi:uncharacterized protein YjbJ (UPF0337 family)
MSYRGEGRASAQRHGGTPRSPGERRNTTRVDRTRGRLGTRRRTAMGGKLDQVKGRLKEAAGVLTDDDRLRREGQLDQVVGKVKGTAERAVDTVKDALTGNRPRRPAK